MFFFVEEMFFFVEEMFFAVNGENHVSENNYGTGSGAAVR